MKLPMPSTEFETLLTHTLHSLEKATKDGGHPKRPRRYRPYPKQMEFHEAGLAHRERLFLAGNQLGKTMAGAFEEAAHATGRYPIWWKGGASAARPTHGSPASPARARATPCSARSSASRDGAAAPCGTATSRRGSRR